jgi:hypothetical protein
MTTRDVTFFVQLAPEFDRYSNGDVVITGLKFVRGTQRYPSPVREGCDVVKVTLRVPTVRLLPMATDVIEIPEGLNGVDGVAEGAAEGAAGGES